MVNSAEAEGRGIDSRTTHHCFVWCVCVCEWGVGGGGCVRARAVFDFIRVSWFGLTDGVSSIPHFGFHFSS